MGKKILIVDDNPDVTFTVKAGLEEIDNEIQVESVDSGEACLEFLESNDAPDIILLDIMMPGISGWETFDKLKAHETWKNIPVVFLTARTDNVAKTAGQFLGEDYIEKPFDINELKKHLDQVFSKE